MTKETASVELQFETIQALQRLLEVGRLLSSVLTPEELKSMSVSLSQSKDLPQNSPKLGNTSIT